MKTDQDAYDMFSRWKMASRVRWNSSSLGKLKVIGDISGAFVLLCCILLAAWLVKSRIFDPAVFR